LTCKRVNLTNLPGLTDDSIPSAYPSSRNSTETDNGQRPWPVAALSDAPGTPREARRPTRGNPEERVKSVTFAVAGYVVSVPFILAQLPPLHRMVLHLLNGYQVRRSYAHMR
jgi:hypothetical protein